MSELRDAIATAAFYSDGAMGAADAVLAMPELQAIRKALLDLADNIAGEFTGVGGRVTAADVLAGNLPPSVVAWVLGGET